MSTDQEPIRFPQPDGPSAPLPIPSFAPVSRGTAPVQRLAATADRPAPLVPDLPQFIGRQVPLPTAPASGPSLRHLRAELVNPVVELQELPEDVDFVAGGSDGGPSVAMLEREGETWREVWHAPVVDRATQRQLLDWLRARGDLWQAFSLMLERRGAQALTAWIRELVAASVQVRHDGRDIIMVSRGGYDALRCQCRDAEYRLSGYASP
jgi:hypothetical protein